MKDTLTLDLFDICENNHGGVSESVDANERVAPYKEQQREFVLQKIKDAGEEGLTCKELARELDVGMNRISGRFSELKRDSEIIQKSDIDGNLVRREHSGVYVALDIENTPF